MSRKSSTGSSQHLRALRDARRKLLREQSPQHYCPHCQSVTFASEDHCLECAQERPAQGWPDLETVNNAWLGKILDGRYLIACALGQGTSGEVYRAESLSISRQFAIKIIATDKGHTQAEQIVARLNREIEALSRLRNPHIVSFYEIFELGENHVAAVMDLIDGDTLEGLVLDNEGLSIPRACSILRQVANGIYEAHQAGMIHRDLKPENLMVERLPAGDDFAHILDFGIVRLTDDVSVKLTHGFIGTPLYASPEQAMAKAIDHRSDIYSLGAILYFMLTGRPPFVSNNVYEVLRMHVRQNPPTLAEGAPGRSFPKALENLTATMLAKQADDRPADLSAVIEELDRFSRAQLSEAHQSEISDASTSWNKEKTTATVQTPISGVAKVPPGLREPQSDGTEVDEEDNAFMRDRHNSSATLQAYGQQRQPVHTPVGFSRNPTPAPRKDKRLEPLPGEIHFGDGGDESSAATAVPSATYKIQSPISKIEVVTRSDGGFALREPSPGEVLYFGPDATSPVPVALASPQTVSSIALAKDHLIAGHDDGRISKTDLSTGQQESLYQDIRRVPISAVATHRQKNCILAGSESGRVYLYDGTQRRSADWRRVRNGEAVQSISLNESADMAAIARRDNTMEILALANPRVPSGTFRVKAPIRSMSISPDDYLLAAVLVDRTIALYQLPTGRQVLSLDANMVDVLSVHFSDDARPVAVCSIEQQIQVLKFEQISSRAASSK